jgi:hypothetical protein
MFRIGNGKQPGEGQVEAALTLDTPVRYDTALVGRLVAEHRELHEELATFAAQLREGEPVAPRIRAFGNRLHELRRSEALWLYPLIARGVAHDAVARRQFLQLRLGMLGLARRVMRQIDELAEQPAGSEELAERAQLAAAALGEYRSRNEGEIYPLYDFIGRQERGLRRLA